MLYILSVCKGIFGMVYMGLHMCINEVASTQDSCSQQHIRLTKEFLFHILSLNLICYGLLSLQTDAY